MIKKSQILALACSLLISAAAGATSMDVQATPQGNQHEYMGSGMNSPLGAEEVYDVPIFVRGGFNDWGTADELAYQGNGIYEVVISIDVGTWEFKVASDDWETVDFGAVDTNTVEFGVPLVIGDASFSNLFLNIDVAGSYLFSLDTNDFTRSLANPMLTVSMLPMPVPAPGTVALIGLGLLIFVARKRRLAV